MNTYSGLNSKITADPELEPTGEVAASIDLFRQAMHAIAERETERPMTAEWLVPAQRRHHTAQRRLILAWSCAAALCVAALPLSFRAAHEGSKPMARFVQPQTVAPTPESDTALLEQVDTAISEPVPSSLEPLTEMDSWSSTNSATESSTYKTEKNNAIQ